MYLRGRFILWFKHLQLFLLFGALLDALREAIGKSLCIVLNRLASLRDCRHTFLLSGRHHLLRQLLLYFFYDHVLGIVLLLPVDLIPERLRLLCRGEFRPCPFRRLRYRHVEISA